jgi:hypothetical protein
MTTGRINQVTLVNKENRKEIVMCSRPRSSAQTFPLFNSLLVAAASQKEATGQEVLFVLIGPPLLIDHIDRVWMTVEDESPSDTSIRINILLPAFFFPQDYIAK